MRFDILKAFLFLHTLLLFGTVAHAQTACPPGMVPYGTGTDTSACGYSAQPQAPPIRWADQWGAIASDPKKGSLGSAINLPSSGDAEQLALAECRSKGGTACKVDLSYHNQCAAMLVSPHGYNVSSGIDVKEAVKEGMKICSDAGDRECRVYFTACSLPKQIR